MATPLLIARNAIKANFVGVGELAKRLSTRTVT
jgi:hypothetical protein